ncbi:AT-rich interactive domain-containing protein 4A-like [Melanaphis sacchari]|uniref:AT-rich interactive domain-containing protein 4A-like n=1 Tax=Melanaphis sacchari TaxID=742174 RepID=UPI000DC14711|nr:AT-rich interactive domain-containing protein 4A-like [Melanaphis sacchari]
MFGDREKYCSDRTLSCFKSRRHLPTNDTLDQFPLNNPEHSGITHVLQNRRSQEFKKDFGESREEEALAIEKKDIGKVICVVTNIKKKVRDNWFPGLIVAPTSQSSVKTNFIENHLVRSFKDGKYYTVSKKEITEYTKEIGTKVENPTLKIAVKKANFYLDNDELPPHWDRDFLFGVDKICTATNDCNNFDEEESIEEKDYFVAQLFKFMDDRETPLNQTPMINEKDVDLFKLFKIVNNCGGYNKVDRCNQWVYVSVKAGHEQQSFLSVKHFYQKYLYSFENFYRKLGCTMLNHKRKARSRNSFSRSIIRDIDKALPSTSSIIDKSNSAKNKLNNKKKKDSTGTKEVVKTIKVEEICQKSNGETSKKDEISNKILHKKKSVTWDPNIIEIKNSVKNFKIKKELKEIDTDILDDVQIVEDKTVEKEKIAIIKSENIELLNTSESKADEVQTKTFLNITVFKNSKRGGLYFFKPDISSERKFSGVPKATKKKKNIRKKTSKNNIIVVNVKVETFNENSTVVVGDDLLVYYNQYEFYEAKVLKIYNNYGVMKYYIHYIGWTLRYNEWIDISRIEFKIIGFTEELEGHNNIDSSKISLPEQTNLDSKKVLSTSSRTRRSAVIPIKSYSLRTKTPYDRTRPTRACTLSNQPFFHILDNYDSETEYSERTVESFKQYSKKKTIKNEPDVVIKPKPLKTNNQKKNLCLKTSLNKNMFLQRNLSSKPKLSGFKICDNKSEEIKIREQDTLKPLLDLNFMIPSQNYSAKSNADNENVEVQYESKISDVTIFEPKITPNHLFLEDNVRKNLDKMSESSKNLNEEIRINAKRLTVTKKLKNFNTIYYSSSSEVEEQNEFKKVTKVISSSLDDKSDKSRISGPDFYLNKIRSDMKEPMLISTNSNNDNIKKTNNLNQQLKIKVSKSYEPITDVYEYKESESCNFDDISSDIDSSKLSNSEKLDELPKVIHSSAQVEVINKNKSTVPFFPILYSMDSFDNKIGIKINENLNHINKIHDSNAHNESDYIYDNDDDDDDDDDEDESRLVIVEDPDYESDENIQAQSLSPLPSSIHPNELEFKSLYPIKKNNTSLVDTDDESIRNDLITSVQMSSYSKSYGYEVDKSMVLPELQFREKMVDKNVLDNTLVIENNHYVAEYDIYKPSTSKGLFHSISQPSTSKDGCYETSTSGDAKNKSFVAKQAFNNMIFDTNIPCKSNLLNHNIPSTNEYNFYENSIPSTSKQFYNPEADVNSIPFYEETIPDSSASKLAEQYEQENTIRIFGKFNNNEIEAILGMCAMSQTCHMPMVITANVIEKKTEENTNTHQNENLRPTKNHGTNMNEPSVTGIVKLSEKSLFKRSTSNSPKQSSKRQKSSSATASNHF